MTPPIVKPDPRSLTPLLDDFQVRPSEAIYIGDSLDKDIKMAQICGLHDVHAKYGRNFDSTNYDQLAEISHWKEDDIASEAQLTTSEVTPNYTVSTFKEVLDVIRMIEASPLLGQMAAGAS